MKLYLRLTILFLATAFVCLCLPVLAKMPTAKIGNNVIKLEVASTNAEIQRGLMYRTSMPEDAGMVFIFHPARPVTFWMYHTKIPLDMIFIKDGKIIKIFENVPPCPSEDSSLCPTYPQSTTIVVTEVVEVNGGYAKRHGIKEGDDVSFSLSL
jgi:uncharacterized membrane protein (UPF0127 family)